jgi:hypothetical protein
VINPIHLSSDKTCRIKGRENGDKDHFVPVQGAKTIEMVLSAFELQNGFPNLYIISPFKTVANNIKILLKMVASQTLYEI